MFPVLVIPYQVRFKPFRQIAFATLMNDTDTKVLEYLSGLANYSDSRILITNVRTEEKPGRVDNKFGNEVSSRIKYPKLTYCNIKGDNVVDALKTMCETVNVDLIAIVHRRLSFLQEVFGESVTRKMIERPDRPLLIFPCSSVKETLAVV